MPQSFNKHKEGVCLSIWLTEEMKRRRRLSTEKISKEYGSAIVKRRCQKALSNGVDSLQISTKSVEK